MASLHTSAATAPNPPCCALPHTIASHSEVYEPSDDTYLFVDTLHMDQDFLNAKQPLLCVEVGIGSGCVSAALSSLLTSPAFFLGTDVNNAAAMTAQKTMQGSNQAAAFDAINMDLVESFAWRFKAMGGVDMLLFNPPYVVTPTEELGISSIAHAWAGGIDGREVLDRLLPQLGRIMSAKGVVYLVAIAENNPEDICQRLREQGFEAEVVAARRAMNERLMIIRAHRDPASTPNG